VSRSAFWHGLRAYPTLLRIGLAEAVAYRAELLVWMLTTTMPLVSMALWSSAAAGQKLGPERMGHADFVAYFTLTLLVRLLTSSWVLWQLTEEIRTGTLGQRLLKPIHPFLTYTAEQLAALPLRGALVMPLSLGLLYVFASEQITRDPWLWLCFLLSLPGAWMINFLSMAVIGLLAFYIDSALGLFYAWMGLYTMLSGYLVPLSLMPPWMAKVAAALPFRYMLETPVRMLQGWPMAGGARDTLAGRHEAFLSLGIEYGFVVILAVATALLWRQGLRRYAAFGG
jgi:ABC-2 type transport system permease protein